MHDPPVHAQQLLLNLRDDVPPSLDNFIVGANTQALHALRTCPAGRALYLWGPPGVGRSHLLRAAATGSRAQYVHASASAAALRRLVNDDTFGCVAIDDVHLLNDAAQAALFDLYNRWREAAATPKAFCLIAAGDRAPPVLPVREDLRTRLGWDLTFRLQALSDQDRAQALRTRAAQRGLELAPDILQWLLTHHSRDMRRLCALIDALDHYSLQTLRPVTLPLLKTVLAHHQAPYTHADTPGPV